MPADKDPRTADDVAEDRVALLMLKNMRPDVRDAVVADMSPMEQNALKVARYWERKAGRG